MIAAIIVAAGEGRRAGLGFNKLLYETDGHTPLDDTLAVFRDYPKILVVSKTDFETVSARYAGVGGLTIAVGGASRGESVLNGLRLLSDADDVLIHDGARPSLSSRDLSRCVHALARYGSCVMVHPAVESVRLDGAAVDRKRVQLVSTPQAFRVEKIRSAYATGASGTDDASVYESVYGLPHLEPLLDQNEKLTTQADIFDWAQKYRRSAESRTGIGFDEHAFSAGRKLILCGVPVESDVGLAGHSDADAPLHALMNALLSAVGSGDIGTRFPDTDPAYLNADSAGLLRQVLETVRDAGFSCRFASLVLHAQRPKLAPYIPAFSAHLSELLEIPVSHIGISATTGEHMGHIGRGEGLAATAICTLAGIPSSKP